LSFGNNFDVPLVFCPFFSDRVGFAVEKDEKMSPARSREMLPSAAPGKQKPERPFGKATFDYVVAHF